MQCISSVFVVTLVDIGPNFDLIFFLLNLVQYFHITRYTKIDDNQIKTVTCKMLITMTWTTETDKCLSIIVIGTLRSQIN